MDLTYDKEIDELLAKLNAAWDSGLGQGGGEMVISADLAIEASNLILKLHRELEHYEALHYNNQIGG